MTVCVDDRVPNGRFDIPPKDNGKRWAANSLYNGQEDCDTVIALGMQGASFAEMCMALGVGKATVKRWAEQANEFKAALEYAFVCAESWWQKKGQENLEHDLEKGRAVKGFRSEVWKQRLVSEYGALDIEGKTADEQLQLTIKFALEQYEKVKAKTAELLARREGNCD